MFIWEQIYDILCWVIPSTDWKHMNWGYASLNADGYIIENLKSQDENERYSIQLYHYMSTGKFLMCSIKLRLFSHGSIQKFRRQNSC